MISPFIINFIIHPIYDGDLANNHKEVEKKYSDFNDADLVVITIPDCPFCHESITKINKLQARNPTLKIKYIVCSSDTNQTEAYIRKLDKKVTVNIASDPNKIATVANLRFPAFLTIKGKKMLYFDNNNFGVRALDYIEEAY